jgi:superfamily II RNA helicase
MFKLRYEQAGNLARLMKGTTSSFRQATAYKQNFISYRMKRTMSLIDEFNAATQSLDRILEKMDEADPADKERLEAYVKSMQVKVQQILKAILRVHSTMPSKKVVLYSQPG